MPFILKSTKAPGLAFDIVKLDKTVSPPVATLRGATGGEFERAVDETTLTKFGYVIVKVEQRAHGS